MYKNQFDTEFSANILYNSYMFYGACDYLIETYATQVSFKIAQGDPIYKIYFEEYNFKLCENYLSQSSLFSQTNILFIKTVKKIPKKELDTLIALCTTNVNSFLIVCCSGETDFRTMAKSFTKKNNACEVRFFNPKDQEALHLLKQVLHQKNIDCGDKELQYLYTMHQKDLNLTVNDLNKLAILQKRITINIINTQCFGMGAVTLDGFLEKLFTAKTINKDLYMILEEGMNEVQLVTHTYSFVQQLFMINSSLRLHGKIDILEIWGYKLPVDIANTRVAIAKKFSSEDFMNMFDFFAQLELDLKMDRYLDKNSYTQAKFRNFSASLR